MEVKSKMWHAIYVASRQEKKVTEQLLFRGIEAYVPLTKTLRQWSDRKKLVELPLIYGYVFVHLTRQEHELMYNVNGIVNFVRAEGKIAVIKDHEIERLKQLVNLGYQLEAESISIKYKEGDKVKIVQGALTGIEGYIVDSLNGKKLEVLLESIGQCIRVKLPKEIITLIEEEQLVC